MAQYTKTAWVDGSAPAISAANLGKIEDELFILSRIFINVKEFGATGDGTTDDTAAIRSAIAAVPPTGGTVYFPPGTYKIVGSAGVGLDLSGKVISFLGSAPKSINEGLLYGSVIFTPTSGLKLIAHENASIFQSGPTFENITFGENVGTGGVILVSLKEVNNWYFRNCSFIGNTGNAGTTGLKIDGISDASYGLVDFCYFRNCFTGISQVFNLSSCRVANSYFLAGAGGSAQNNHKLIDVQGDAMTIIGCKFECNDNTGSIAINIARVEVEVIGNHFEGCPIAVNLPNQASYLNMGVQIVGNSFLGSNTTETGVSIGTNCACTAVLANRFSNLLTDVVDNGTLSTIMYRPDFAATTGKFMTFSGIGLFAGSANPPTNPANNGSLYLGSNGMWFRTGGAWTQVTIP